MNKVLVMLANGFEEVEALTVVDYLRRTGIEVKMVSTEKDLEVEGAHGIKVIGDVMIDNIKDPLNYRGIFIPGGLPGATNLRDDSRVTDLVRTLADGGKMIASICAGPIVLSDAGVIDGKKVTSYPGYARELVGALYKEDLVVRDGNILTSRGPATAVYLAMEIIRYLQGEEKLRELRKAILLDLVNEKKKG
ncbi:DJ-1 family glyoxalase III [Gudongella sp. SC589]|uniref:DJ-1 family glyoxalase III n=1 Tax=Gudongella sp. SC589 TaxID=3385990 RepID=UPI0039046FFC